MYVYIYLYVCIYIWLCPMAGVRHALRLLVPLKSCGTCRYESPHPAEFGSFGIYNRNLDLLRVILDWRFSLLFVCSFGKSKINHPEFVADRCVYPYLGLNGGHQSSDFLRVWLAMWNVDGNTMTESAPIFVVSSCGLFGVLKQAEGVARIDFCSFLTI